MLQVCEVPEQFDGNGSDVAVRCFGNPGRRLIRSPFRSVSPGRAAGAEVFGIGGRLRLARPAL